MLQSPLQGEMYPVSIPFDTAAAEAIADLGENLASSGLKVLLRTYQDVANRLGVLEFDLPLLPPRLAELAAFFCLGRSIPLTTAAIEIPVPALRALASAGILLISDREVKLSPSMQLIDHHGVLLFTGRPSFANYLYYGAELDSTGRDTFGD